MLIQDQQQNKLMHDMPPSMLSFIHTRSLSSTRIPHPPLLESSFEHINVSTIDTPTHSLRAEILIGFHPIHPHSLVTLSRPNKSPAQTPGDCELGLWEFHPGCPVRLLQRLIVAEQPGYLPVTVASTCFSSRVESYYQALYRSAGSDGEGCIEVRCISLRDTEKSWNVWESVTEEDGLLGGVCWNLVDEGYCTVATASRVYFFTEDTEFGDMKEEYWTCGQRCLIFEVDVFLQRFVPESITTRYATRLIHSNDKTVSILVFLSQKSQLQSFKLEIDPRQQGVKVCAKTDIVQWKSGAKGALIAWAMGKNLMTAHCCEDECGEKRDDGTISVFKTWFAREKRSLKHLVWEYGGVIVDCWDT